jgi:hypothetical protein
LSCDATGAFIALVVSAAGLLAMSRTLGSVARVPEEIRARLLDNITRHGLASGFVDTFRVSFSSPTLQTDYVLAALLGPFPPRVKAACGLVFAFAIFVALFAHMRDPFAETERPRRGVRPACALFALAVMVAPAAIQIPNDLSRLEFRLITTAVLLSVAALPPHAWARARAPRWALACAAAALLAVWARQLGGISSELAPAVHLMARLGPSDRLLSLPMHDDSAYLEDANSVLHYDAMFHTARTGGITSLFWAKFSPRLPIGYRPLKEPAHPPDWAPWALEETQLTSYTHVFVRWPAPDEEARTHELAARVVRMRDAGVLVPLACEGGCCLFAVNVVPADDAHASR